MFRKGKVAGIKDKLEGFTKLDKALIAGGEGVLITDVVKGHSDDNGDFIYILGYYQSKPVFVSVPAASLEDFQGIDQADIEEITRNELKLYVESKTSKSGRQYFIAWIDD